MCRGWVWEEVGEGWEGVQHLQKLLDGCSIEGGGWEVVFLLRGKFNSIYLLMNGILVPPKTVVLLSGFGHFLKS
jgi:hypothetical protein